MFEVIITVSLATLAIWFLLDSVIEYVRDGSDETLATEP